VNLDDMRHLIVEGVDIRVSDQANGSDITNARVRQILGSRDRDSGTVLSAVFLTDLIRAAARNHDPSLPERLQIALRDVLPI
jgi:polyhydroxyalkanoate synthesis regulator protein